MGGSAKPIRPDLEESRWRRAKVDAKGRGLNTVVGLLVTTACGATGGVLGSQWGTLAVIAGATIGAGIGIALFLGMELARAPRKQRDDLRKYLKGRHEIEQKIEQFKATCIQWADDVEKLCDAQEAKEPAHPSRRNFADNLIYGFPKEAPDRAEQRERIRGETVSLYIEKYRDPGIGYFDLLIGGGYIVPTNRPKIAEPKSPDDIRDGADSMRTAAGRL